MKKLIKKGGVCLKPGDFIRLFFGVQIVRINPEWQFLIETDADDECAKTISPFEFEEVADRIATSQGLEAKARHQQEGPTAYKFIREKGKMLTVIIEPENNKDDEIDSFKVTIPGTPGKGTSFLTSTPAEAKGLIRGFCLGRPKGPTFAPVEIIFFPARLKRFFNDTAKSFSKNPFLFPHFNNPPE